MAKNSIVVESQSDEAARFTSGSSLVSWVTETIEPWRQWRQQNYDDKWKEYYRIWRGVWKSEDKTRDSERSKLISPATQQAVEATVSELEEATFGKGNWFDVEDDVQDQQKQDLILFRDQLRQDLELNGVPSEISKVFLNGAIMGTGIAKVIVEEVDEKVIVSEVIDEVTGISEPITQSRPAIKVSAKAIHPLNFLIDPAAKSIDEALGCAHEFMLPTHLIQVRQNEGVYNDVPLGSLPDLELTGTENESKFMDMSSMTKIIEYYGKVPEALLDEYEVEDQDALLDKILEGTNVDLEEENLVEAIVTIANDSALLRAVRNPYLMGDRPVVAYQHDTVTDSFFGRGVVEKGYNAQKALDAELRARIDAMSLSAHPMVAMDGSRLMRGQNYAVRPGKIWLTNGDPSQIITPFKLSDINASTFHQTGDLERMIQMGTGAMDSAAPLNQNPRNSTASGMSMMQSMFIKRSKRSMQAIERNFLDPLIKKALWRYMQFDPERYPVQDYKFKVVATMGIVAREFEQNQLTQLLSIVPAESSAFRVILQGIFENSSLSNKPQLMEALAKDGQPSQMEQAANQMQLQQMQLQLQNLQEEIRNLQSDTFLNIAEANKKLAEAKIGAAKVQVDAAKLFVNGGTSGKGSS